MTSFRIPLRQVDPEIRRLGESVDRNPERVLDILRALQQQRNGLTPEMVEDVARVLSIPPARAYGVATFYSMLSMPPDEAPALYVCDGVVCWLKGAAEVQRLATEQGWTVKRSSCLGLCDRVPAAYCDGRQFGPLDPESIDSLREALDSDVSATLPQARPGELRCMLQDIEHIDPDSIDSALNHGVYRALRSMLTESHTSPDQLIRDVERSGVLGRGGAGFPTGRKWRAAANEPAVPRYVVCNADESEPLTFKDRVLMDTNPHLVIEGMALCGYAVGAETGIIYIRGEYEPQARRLERAILQAEERNVLGSNILGSSFSFHVHIHRGAGAYICGEGSALISSLEGERGLPRFRPPRTTTSGFRGRPTVVNNVETFAAVAWVARYGADAYLRTGHPDYPGTKLYGVMGCVNNPGLFEAPYRITLRQIIEDFGGGLRDGSSFNFALTGGAAGAIVGPALLDAPIEFGADASGVMLGAGGFLICDQTTSPVELLRELSHFFEVESCGKCTPCRIGTVEVRRLLDQIVANGPGAGDAQRLASLANVLRRDSFCALGESVADPIESALLHFPHLFRPEAMKS